MKTRNLFGILCVSIATLTAQSSIVYSPGPLPPPPPLVIYSPQSIDFDGDGLTDVSFSAGFSICTDDVPTSFCDMPFGVGVTGTNQILASGYYSAVQPLGELIGVAAPTNSTWSVPGFQGYLTDQWWSLRGREIDGQLVHWGWGGPLGSSGVGYLGVRFYNSDGVHYGWVRVRAGIPGLVVDWAYETQPETPIRAGDIGTDSDSVQFKVEFFDPSPRHRQPRRLNGTGSFILTDSNLRGELLLPGKFSSAELRGPANPRARTKPVWSFGAPLVASTNQTAFFGETTLTRAQIIALAHGLIYVSVDDRDLVGRITPVEHDKKRRR